MGDEDHKTDPEDWLFKRQRNGMEHRDNCTEGFRKLAIAEIHHILCVHACSDANMPADAVDYIHKCMAMTTWNINSGANNIGLPKKWAYVNAVDQAATIADRTKGLAGKAALDATFAADDWDGLPCHQVDHAAYLTAVEDWVLKNIWNKLQKEQKAKNCKTVNGRNIATMFDNGITEYKGFLKSRGQKYGGTRHCLAYSVKDDGAHLPLVTSQGKWSCGKKTWYIPFSMEPVEKNVRERRPPQVGKKGIIRELMLSIH